MTTEDTSRLGAWLAFARDRTKVMLVDGREAVLIGVQRHAGSCKILIGGAHKFVMADDVSFYWCASEECWKQLTSWPIEDSWQGQPSSPPSWQVRASSKSWLRVGSPESVLSKPLPVPVGPPPGR